MSFTCNRQSGEYTYMAYIWGHLATLLIKTLSPWNKPIVCLWECFIIQTVPLRSVYKQRHSQPFTAPSTHPPSSPSLRPQLPSSPHTLPRHLINVTHRLPSKTEGIVFVSSAADKGFWKADMHNDSTVIASLVWSPFLSVPHAACCCLTE